MHTVRKLKEVYEKVDIPYETVGFEKPENAQVFYASVADILYLPADLEEICIIFLQLREDMLPMAHH